MKRPSKQEFLIGTEGPANSYDRVGHIKALNKYIDYLENKSKLDIVLYEYDYNDILGRQIR
jgi:hypothetical protein